MKKISLLIGISLYLLLFVNHSPAQSLKDKKITIKMTNAALGSILDYLVKNYDIPIGFEDSDTDGEVNNYEFQTNDVPVRNGNLPLKDNQGRVTVEIHMLYKKQQPRFNIDAQDKPLGSVLNIIVKQMKNFKWEINDEVVNFIPVNGRNPRLEKLLGMNMNELTIKKGHNFYFISDYLIAAPEIKEFSKSNNLLVYTYRSVGSAGNLLNTLTDDIELSNLTFREALNRIIKINRGGWILKRHFDDRESERQYFKLQI